jgi:hypothetical protein
VIYPVNSGIAIEQTRLHAGDQKNNPR